MSVGDDGIAVTGLRPVDLNLSDKVSAGPINTVHDLSRGRYETTCTHCAQRIESNNGVWWTKGTCQSACSQGMVHEPHVKIERMTGRMMYEMCPAAHQVRSPHGAGPDFTLCRRQIGHTGAHEDHMGALWNDDRDPNARPESDPKPEHGEAPVKARRKSAAAGLIER